MSSESENPRGMCVRPDDMKALALITRRMLRYDDGVKIILEVNRNVIAQLTPEAAASLPELNIEMRLRND